MKHLPRRPIAALTTLSLALSLLPAPGIAYAVGGDEPLAAEQENVLEDAAADGAAEGTLDGQAEGTDEASELAVDGTSAEAVTSDQEELAAAEPQTDEGALSPAAEDGPKAEGDQAAQVIEENREAIEAQKQQAAEEERQFAEMQRQLLSESELQSLAVELPESEVLRPEEGGINLIAQAINGWSRISGETALDTMQRVVQAEGAFATNRGGEVIVATSEGYWDALAASGIAGVFDAPIVLTASGSLSPQARSEIARLRPSHVCVVGGSSSVSHETFREIQQLCPSVDRLCGPQAQDTAVAIFDAGTGWGKTAIVATSNGYWDALSIAPYAWHAKAPIFLTGGNNELSELALNAIRDGGFERAVIVGGDGSVSTAVEGQLQAAGVGNVIRKNGHDALATSAEIAKWEVSEGMTLEHLAVASSGGYWDALSAGPLCGKQNSVLVLVSKSGDFTALDAVYNYKKDAVYHGHIIGGLSSIPDAVENRVKATWLIKDVVTSAQRVRNNTDLTYAPIMEYGSYDPSEFSYNHVWSRNGSWEPGEYDTDVVDGKGAVKEASRDVHFSRPGRYDFYIDVYGPDGTKQSAMRSVDVYQLQGININTTGALYTATPGMGTPDNHIVDVEYRYTWAREGSSEIGELRGWSPDPQCVIDPAALGGWNNNYIIAVEARDKAGSLGATNATLVPDPMTARAQGYGSPTGWLIMVDWTNCWMGLYTGSQGNWQRVRYYRCSVGIGDATPIGTFALQGRGYSFSGTIMGDPFHCYWWVDYWQHSWAFHSVPYNYGSTESIYDGRLGEHNSGGCIRQAMEDAKFLYDNCPEGTTVVIYK